MPKPTIRFRSIDDVRLAAVAGLIADEARARILLALSDGRALPASVLAREAGIVPSTCSSHLSKLLNGGFIVVEQHGRFRYFRISGRDVAECLEKLAKFSCYAQSRSQRISTREHKIRIARTCYNHLAGRLGVAIMQSLIRAELLKGHDGTFDRDKVVRDRLSAPGSDNQYQLTPSGVVFFNDFGISPEKWQKASLRYCVDWSEQKHHLSGGLGTALLRRLEELKWIVRSPNSREVAVTHQGVDGFRAKFGFDWATVRDIRSTPAWTCPVKVESAI